MKRILACLPGIPYSDAGGFWFRDVGLSVMTLRTLGYDAWLIVYGKPGEPRTNYPVIIATEEQLSNPEWWQAQKPDGVILNTWSAPRYDAMRAAALKATPHAVETLDTDGFRSPSVSICGYFLQSYSRYREVGSPWYRKLLAPFIAATRTSAVRC